MKKGERLKTLNEKWSKDCLCDLKNTATQAVFGMGSPSANIVFIGEAPGKSEDKLGVPFVGASGKFLDEMLESIKLKREDVYITNIVKYRPPDNRDPKPLEKEQCFEWLCEELNLINPKLIIFLGRHSMSSFFPGFKIAEVHGKLINGKFNNIRTKNFLPLYHPAAALYNGGMREILINDFRLIPKILEKIID